MEAREQWRTKKKKKNRKRDRAYDRPMDSALSGRPDVAVLYDNCSNKVMELATTWRTLRKTAFAGGMLSNMSPAINCTLPIEMEGALATT